MRTLRLGPRCQHPAAMSHAEVADGAVANPGSGHATATNTPTSSREHGCTLGVGQCSWAKPPRLASRVAFRGALGLHVGFSEKLALTNASSCLDLVSRINRSIHRCIDPSMRQSINIIHPSIDSSIHPHLNPSIDYPWRICPCIHPFMPPSIHASIHPSMHPFIIPSMGRSIDPPIPLFSPMHPFMHP